ncbi:unnamed protein product [Durusdinium trenchii]|uniref:Uncharacterized protein n=1 Tax=Durusdinium trenchii TaxID=1381693 RepID=A0ABP0SEF7_9DINO
MRFPAWPLQSRSSSSSPTDEKSDKTEDSALANHGIGHCFSKAVQVIREQGAQQSKEPGFTPEIDGDEDEGEANVEARARASWLMIWCHERCYKPERELRAHLTDVAMNLSAGILCMKKAVKYETWMKRTKNRFHVLITDWREAKPCMNAVEESLQTDWPEMIIVLCDLPKSHENALQWASKQDSNKAKIHVLLESPDQQHFQVITELLQSCYAKMSKRRRSDQKPEQREEPRPMLLPSTPGPLAAGTQPDVEKEMEGSTNKVLASEADSDELREALRNGSILSL